MKVAVSYFSDNNYKECIKKIDNSISDYIHCDIADGKYVEANNLSNTKPDKLFTNINKPLDIHLMVQNPDKYIDSYALYNVNTISFHPSTTKNPKDLIERIHNMGIRAGIAINPDETIDTYLEYIPLIDHILVMSVVPGKGGQSFIIDTIAKIDYINTFKNKYNFTLAVDGGINDETIKYLDNKDIDYVISGSFITNSIDYNEQIKKIL